MGGIDGGEQMYNWQGRDLVSILATQRCLKDIVSKPKAIERNLLSVKKKKNFEIPV